GARAIRAVRLRDSARDCTHEVALTNRPLVNLHVAGTGVHGNRGTAAAHLAHSTLPRLLNSPLYRRSHGMAQRDGSGMRGDVDVEGGVGGHMQGHVARARADAPHVFGRTLAVNVAAARLGTESTIDAVYGDVARAGADVHVARTYFLDFDVTAARFDLRGSGKFVAADVSRARLETHFTGEARQLHVARPTLEIDVTLEAFDLLIAAAGMGTNRGVLGDGDFVVDRNVVEIDVVDADAVAVLANWRIVLQILHRRLVVAAEPRIARVDLGMNRNRARSTVPDGDVAGASKHFEIDGATDLERTVKGSNDRSEAGP